MGGESWDPWPSYLSIYIYIYIYISESYIYKYIKERKKGTEKSNVWMLQKRSGKKERLNAWPGSHVLADKGFPQITDSLNNRGALLVMPPMAPKTRALTQNENSWTVNNSEMMNTFTHFLIENRVTNLLWNDENIHSHFPIENILQSNQPTFSEMVNTFTYFPIENVLQRGPPGCFQKSSYLLS